MSEKQVLAVDYGASGGRVMLGGFDGASLTISELHRFPNDPVKLGDTKIGRASCRERVSSPV